MCAVHSSWNEWKSVDIKSGERKKNTQMKPAPKKIHQSLYSQNWSRKKMLSFSQVLRWIMCSLYANYRILRCWTCTYSNSAHFIGTKNSLALCMSAAWLICSMEISKLHIKCVKQICARKYTVNHFTWVWILYKPPPKRENQQYFSEMEIKFEKIDWHFPFINCHYSGISPHTGVLADLCFSHSIDRDLACWFCKTIIWLSSIKYR